MRAERPDEARISEAPTVRMELPHEREPSASLQGSTTGPLAFLALAAVVTLTGPTHEPPERPDVTPAELRAALVDPGAQTAKLATLEHLTADEVVILEVGKVTKDHAKVATLAQEHRTSVRTFRTTARRHRALRTALERRAPATDVLALHVEAPGAVLIVQTPSTIAASF